MKSTKVCQKKELKTTEEILSEIMETVKLNDLCVKNVSFAGKDPIVASPHRLGDATSAALGALGLALSSIWEIKKNEKQKVTIDVKKSILQLTAVYLGSINNIQTASLLDDPGCWETNDFYKTKDNRWVYIVNTLPRLRDIVCRVLDCPPTHEAYTKKVSQWISFDLENAISEKGGCCVVVRDEKEWFEHEQGVIEKNSPLLKLKKILNSNPVKFDSHGDNILSGLKVIDNTHIIAGPITARIMAEYGADILHISRPGYADPTAMILETGLGKKNAYCDFNNENDLDKLKELIKKSDVWINSYRNLEKFGLSADDIAKINPKCVIFDITCYDTSGPWAKRGGFDQIAQAVSGFSFIEGGEDTPILPPTHLVNDYLAAILGATAVISALRLREREGGSWKVDISLAKICTWINSLGLFEKKEYEHIAIDLHKDSEKELSEIVTSYGIFRYLPTQIHLTKSKPKFIFGSRPLGSSFLSW